MRILIIGGTGLISAPMTQMLLAQGDDVTHFNRGRLDLYPAPAGVTTVHGDRTDYAAFERQVQDLGLFDCVIDMVGYLPEDAHSTVRAFRGRTGQFLFCSTVDVYRKPAARYPVTENEEYGGLNTYSRNKVAIEQTLFAAYAAGNFPLTVIRPAYTYGEGRGPLHSFGGRTSYVDRIRRGKPIVVHGDGSSFWTACHKDDVARAFVAATRNPQTIGRAYHTPGEEWLTWDMYHQVVAEALGAPLPRNSSTYPPMCWRLLHPSTGRSVSKTSSSTISSTPALPIPTWTFATPSHGVKASGAWPHGWMLMAPSNRGMPTPTKIG